MLFVAPLVLLSLVPLASTIPAPENMENVENLNTLDLALGSPQWDSFVSVSTVDQNGRAYLDYYNYNQEPLWTYNVAYAGDVYQVTSGCYPNSAATGPHDAMISCSMLGSPYNAECGPASEADCLASDVIDLAKWTSSTWLPGNETVCPGTSDNKTAPVMCQEWVNTAVTCTDNVGNHTSDYHFYTTAEGGLSYTMSNVVSLETLLPICESESHWATDISQWQSPAEWDLGLLCQSIEDTASFFPYVQPCLDQLGCLPSGSTCPLPPANLANMPFFANNNDTARNITNTTTVQCCYGCDTYTNTCNGVPEPAPSSTGIGNGTAGNGSTGAGNVTSSSTGSMSSSGGNVSSSGMSSSTGFSASSSTGEASSSTGSPGGSEPDKKKGLTTGEIFAILLGVGAATAMLYYCYKKNAEDREPLLNDGEPLLNE